MLNKEDEGLLQEFSQVIEAVSEAVIDRALKKEIKEKTQELKKEFTSINTRVNDHLNNTDQNVEMIKQEVKEVDRLLKELIKQRFAQTNDKLVEFSKKIDTEFDVMNSRINKRLNDSEMVSDCLKKEGVKLEEMFQSTEVLVETMKELESISQISSIMRNLKSDLKRIEETNESFIETIKAGKKDLKAEKKNLNDALKLYGSKNEELIKQYDYFKSAHQDIIETIKKEANDLNSQWVSSLVGFREEFDGIYNKLDKKDKLLSKSLKDLDTAINKTEQRSKKTEKRIVESVKQTRSELKEEMSKLRRTLASNQKHRGKIYDMFTEKVTSLDHKYAKLFRNFTVVNLIFIFLVIYLLLN